MTILALTSLMIPAAISNHGRSRGNLAITIFSRSKYIKSSSSRVEALVPKAKKGKDDSHKLI